MMKRIQSFVVGVLLALSFAGISHATSFTDYLENKIVDWLFRAQSFTPPAVPYVALHTASCSDSSAGTEVSGGSYARVAATAGTTVWANTQDSGTGVSSGTNGTTKNLVALTFPAPTANWGTVTHWSLNDAISAGNQLICQSLTVSKTINNGDSAPSFGVGSLTIQVDN